MKAFRCGFRLILLTLLFLASAGPHAWADTRYAVSEKNVLIRIGKDGSADVTERIVYAIKGSVNNLVLAFMKPDSGGIGFERLISEGTRGDVVCRPLEAGQWDPTVFSGTYSLYDEPDSLKVRAYYVFGTYRSRFVAQYRIDGAVGRHADCADFQYVPVGADWPTRVENIHVQVVLPDTNPAWKPEAYIRGVFVGKADVAADGMVSFDIPDTVPGEAPVLRVLFPQEQVPGMPFAQPQRRLEAIRREEALLRREAEEPSLRARENAAREAGQRAFAAIIAHRTRMAASVLSVLLALLGTAFFLWVRFRVREPRPVPPSLPKLALLADNPWLARMLLHGGRFDARALLAALVHACETGEMMLAVTGEKRPLLALRGKAAAAGLAPRPADLPDSPNDVPQPVDLPDSPNDVPQPANAPGGPYDAPLEAFRRHLAAWTALLADDAGVVRFPQQGEPGVDPERADRLRHAWKALVESASDSYRRCGFTTRIHERIRRISLAAGMLLVAGALVAGVGLAIAQPYLMALPGVALVWLGMSGNAANSRAVGFRRALRQVARQLRQHRKTPSCVVTVPTMVNNRLATTRQPVAPRLSLALAIGAERPCLEDDGLRIIHDLVDSQEGRAAADDGIRRLARSMRTTLRRLGWDILPAMRGEEGMPDHA